MDLVQKKDTILDYPDISLPAAGEAREIVPGVRWVRMPLPMALDHVNLWLLADGDQWAAVDTGISTEAIKGMWESVLGTHPLSHLVVTHMHPDHLGLAHWLQEKTGAPLWMTLGEYTVAQLFLAQMGNWSFREVEALYARHGLSEELQQALASRGSSYAKGVPSIPATFRRMVDGDMITIGDHEWKVITGTGHSPEHASLYCADLGILVSGDMMLPRISTNVGVSPTGPEDDGLGRFLDSIARFRDLPEDTLVLPAHGRPFCGLHLRIAQLEAHHAERCELLAEACVEPKTAAELIPVLFDRPINDAHQIFFALGEAIAHLNHLQRYGRLQRVDDGTTIRFITVA
ncbi:MAG TPA: MBL fold metallo-hydrolase [Rhodocyclaceae bacterium]|nr:MBL fold metallo-hydrolase [Rhodocyclaceae bacterium]